jgi:hypothetical protein
MVSRELLKSLIFLASSSPAVGKIRLTRGSTTAHSAVKKCLKNHHWIGIFCWEHLQESPKFSMVT